MSAGDMPYSLSIRAIHSQMENGLEIALAEGAQARALPSSLDYVVPS